MTGFGYNQGQKKNKKKTVNLDQYKQEIILKAFSFHSKGKLMEASRFYQRFLDEGFSDPRVFSNYGAIFKQFGQFDKAINLYEQAISLFPSNAIAYSNLGSILIDLGEIRGAFSVRHTFN